MTWQDNLKSRIQNNRNKKQQKLMLFDSDKVDLLKYESSTSDFGFTLDGWKIIQKDFICDLNDSDDDKNKRVWGYDIVVDKTLICRTNDLITEDCLIKNEDVIYKIVKLRKCKNTDIHNWDGYYKIALQKNEEQEINIIDGGE